MRAAGDEPRGGDGDDAPPDGGRDAAGQAPVHRERAAIGATEPSEPALGGNTSQQQRTERYSYLPTHLTLTRR